MLTPKIDQIRISESSLGFKNMIHLNACFLFHLYVLLVFFFLVWVGQVGLAQLC